MFLCKCVFVCSQAHMYVYRCMYTHMYVCMHTCTHDHSVSVSKHYICLCVQTQLYRASVCMWFPIMSKYASMLFYTARTIVMLCVYMYTCCQLMYMIKACCSNNIMHLVLVQLVLASISPSTSTSHRMSLTSRSSQSSISSSSRSSSLSSSSSSSSSSSLGVGYRAACRIHPALGY